ncbi:peptidoglycan-binding protein [Pseudofrankia inefficax]|nr:peptidoglycan-binding protein [Pseudofrankia inefficax]
MAASQSATERPARSIRLLHGAVGGPDVELLQDALAAVGYDPGRLDGIYGPLTASAVRRYQGVRGIAQDGIVGPATWEALAAEPNSPLAGRPLRVTIAGAVAGDDVRRVQEGLSSAGFDPGPIDAVYGPMTARAVRRFQLVHGLGADGIVGPRTLAALTERRLGLTPSVASVLQAVGDEPVSPSGLARTILRDHPHYAGGRASEVTFATEPAEVRFRAVRWLGHVRALFRPGLVRLLRGRFVVVGLCLLDPSLAGRLGRVFFDELIGELHYDGQPGGEFQASLTARGRRAADRLNGSPARSLAQLTPAARRAFGHAEALRLDAGAQHVHTDHLMAGLQRAGTGSALRLLSRAHLEADDLTALLGETSGHRLPETSSPRRLDEVPPLSSHAAEAWEHAFRVADAIGSEVVRSRYLLHGLLSVDGCTLVHALAGRGVRADGIDGWDEPVPAAADQPMLLAGARADTVPEPGEGRLRDADRLGAADYVEMLASVLVAKDTPPPLAVGLFGSWGSGKSFFMAQLQERIDELAAGALLAAKADEETPFHGRIRQIRFNAWHYADANLWASLATALFDGLVRPTRADATAQDAAVAGELEKARNTVAAKRAEREKKDWQARAAERAAGRVTAVLTEPLRIAIREFRDRPELWQQVRALGRAATGDEAGVPRADTETDAAAERTIAALGGVEDLVGKIRAVRLLATEELVGQPRRRWLTLASLLVLLGAAGAVAALTGWPPGAKVAAFAVPFLAPAAVGVTAATRLLRLVREAREQRELRVFQARDAAARARVEEEEAEAWVALLDRRLAEQRNKGARLRQFVRARAASSDYRDQLGVVSKLRRDLEQLAELIEIGPHVQPVGGPAVVTSPADRDPTGADPVDTVRVTDPATEAAARAKQREVEAAVEDLADWQVRRIFLYIDDLDRCSHGTVVEVLQAVHLLLAFKLFVVVVGVDSRWLTHSLRVHYAELLEEPSDYLEKIFQVPFALPPMETDHYRSLIADLVAQRSPAWSVATARSSDDESDRRGQTGPEPPVDESPPGDRATPPPSTPPPDDPELDARPAGLPPPPPEALLISAAEASLLGELSEAVATPRSAKRLINIYRMLRVSVRPDERDGFTPGRGNEYQAVIVLLGILVGRPSEAAAVFESVRTAAPDDEIWDILAAYEDVARVLAPLRDRRRVSVTHVDPYQRWAPRVGRFAFIHHAVPPTGGPPRPALAAASRPPLQIVPDSPPGTPAPRDR